MRYIFVYTKQNKEKNVHRNTNGDVLAMGNRRASRKNKPYVHLYLYFLKHGPSPEIVQTYIKNSSFTLKHFPEHFRCALAICLRFCDIWLTISWADNGFPFVFEVVWANPGR